MKYKEVIEDFNNGTIDRDKFILVMDNDGGYWQCIDESISEAEQEKLESDMEEKYGSPDGYQDIVDVLNAAGVNADWC